MTPQEILKKLNEKFPGYDFKLEESKQSYGFVSLKDGRFGGGLKKDYNDEDAKNLILHTELFIRENRI